MNFLDYFKERRRVKRTINELGRLTDRELSDIGIYRTDIVRIAKGHKNAI